MAEFLGFFTETTEISTAVKTTTYGGISDTPDGDIGVRSREHSVVFNPLIRWDSEYPISSQGTLGRYTFPGLFVDQDDTGDAVRENRVFQGISDQDVFVGVRPPVVVEVIKLPIFLWDASIPIDAQGVRTQTEYQGLITWGDGGLPPRKYPLESTWKNPQRK